MDPAHEGHSGANDLKNQLYFSSKPVKVIKEPHAKDNQPPKQKEGHLSVLQELIGHGGSEECSQDKGEHKGQKHSRPAGSRDEPMVNLALPWFIHSAQPCTHSARKGREHQGQNHGKKKCGKDRGQIALLNVKGS